MLKFEPLQLKGLSFRLCFDIRGMLITDFTYAQTPGRITKKHHQVRIRTKKCGYKSSIVYYRSEAQLEGKLVLYLPQ